MLGCRTGVLARHGSRPEGVRISPGAIARGHRTGAAPNPPAVGFSQSDPHRCFALEHSASTAATA
eukprot:6855002-Prymnesium_polylepis.1